MRKPFTLSACLCALLASPAWAEFWGDFSRGSPAPPHHDTGWGSPGAGIGILVIIVVGYLGRRFWRIGKAATSKGVRLGRQAASLTMGRIEGALDREGAHDELYVVAYNEVSSNALDEGCWAKAFANAAGQPEKAKALYIQYRVAKLKASEGR